MPRQDDKCEVLEIRDVLALRTTSQALSQKCKADVGNRLSGVAGDLGVHNLRTRWVMKNVGDLMQRDVVTLEASDHLDFASDVMQLGRIRHMPIVEGAKVVGILSQRDLFRAGISSALQFRPSSEREWLAKISVREVMCAPVVTLQEREPLRAAVDIMIRKKIGCLPVVDANGGLVGLLSESDLLLFLERLLDQEESREQVPGLSAPTPPSRSAGSR